MLWAVLDGHELLDVLDDAAPTCSAGYPPPCGGCTACLFAQADYSNLTVIPVPVDASRRETFGDALSNILTGVQIPGRLPAMQACLDHGWKPGQILASTLWPTPRKIDGIVRDPKIMIPHQAVRMSGGEYLYTFPEDVHPIEAGHDGNDCTVA